MTREIRPLTADDIPALSQFLTTGFDTAPEADYATPDVLRWKYIEPYRLDRQEAEHIGLTAPRSFIACDENGTIIGHLGLCRTAFEGQALKVRGGRVPTIHIIDWLGSPEHRAVGTSLMRRAHEDVATQFGLGVSQAALVVGERIGYELRSLVPVYARALRPQYWLRSDGSSIVARSLRLSRDVTRRWIHPPAALPATIVLERVSQFGTEIDPIVSCAKTYAILTSRHPARLNAMLRFPRQMMTGWYLRDSTGRLRGLAVLNIVPTNHGRTRTGKVVDCLLDNIDVDHWHAAMFALTSELKRQNADVVQAYASAPWTVEALRRSGYESKFAVKFHIRDRQGLIPREAIFHLTPLEGDYAYT